MTYQTTTHRKSSLSELRAIMRMGKYPPADPEPPCFDLPEEPAKA